MCERIHQTSEIGNFSNINFIFSQCISKQVTPSERDDLPFLLQNPPVFCVGFASQTLD